MKIHQNKVIWELIAELLENGCSVKIRPRSNWKFQVRVRKHHAVDSFELVAFSELEQTLCAIVDRLRLSQGRETISEEVTRLLAENQKHADAPPVELGPDASCGCGSRKPLIVERKIRLDVDWQMGIMRPTESQDYPHALSGEIGTCPDCGRHYTFDQ
jgi:hypothetical protein